METDLLQNILCNYCDESGSVLETTDEGRISLSVSGESNPYSFDVYNDSGVIILLERLLEIQFFKLMSQEIIILK